MTQRGRQPRDFSPDPDTGRRKWFDVGDTATQILARKSNANGRSAYRSGIVAFCDANMIHDLDAYIEQAKNDNHVIDHIEQMVIWLQDQGRAPYTIKTNLTGVKYLFRRLKLNVDSRDVTDLLKDRELARAHTLTKKITLRKDELRQVISQLPSHGKACALVLVSSGMRVSEALTLHMNDLHLDENPPRIEVQWRKTKTKQPRDVFISYEAREALRAWLAEKAYHNTRTITGRGKRKFDPTLVFGFSYQNIREMWNRALDKVSLGTQDNDTQYRLYHLHGLRKFYRSKIKMDRDYVELTLGHFSNELDHNYLFAHRDEIAQEYLQHMGNVSVFDDIAQERFKPYEEENRVLKAELQQLQLQMHDLQQSRVESDGLMDRLIGDPEFLAVFKRKIRELS